MRLFDFSLDACRNNFYLVFVSKWSSSSGVVEVKILFDWLPQSISHYHVILSLHYSLWSWIIFNSSSQSLKAHSQLVPKLVLCAKQSVKLLTVWSAVVYSPQFPLTLNHSASWLRVYRWCTSRTRASLASCWYDCHECASVYKRSHCDSKPVQIFATNAEVYNFFQDHFLIAIILPVNNPLTLILIFLDTFLSSDFVVNSAFFVF